MKRRTIGQQRAVVELRALARTALMVCDVIAARGEEADDRGRNYLNALVRWTIGEEEPAQLAAATRAMERAREREFTADHKIPPPSTVMEDVFGDALHWSARASANIMRNPGHEHHTARVCRCLAAALSQYRRGEENHSADELHVLDAGGPALAQRHRAVMRHLRALDARRLP